GSEIVPSQNRLLSTVAYRLDGKPTYALEGSIFIAGAAVQWLRDGLQLFSSSSETAERAERASVDANVVMVPAFTGMGAPYWSLDARAAIFGMTRATGPDELARAALEGVVYQTHDLLQAMVKDGVSLTSLKVDGGMASNDWFVQRLSDIVNVPIDRPKVLETTALGAAYLAGLKIGLYTSLSDIEKNWQLADQAKPQMDASHREERLARWQKCVQAVLDVADVS
ncbi:MAG: FGGY-family carbohydrate kinase, partial [Pseudomonadota bacterium]